MAIPARRSPPPPRGRKARKVVQKKPRSQGWHSTDEDEIERRRLRAASEPLGIEALEAGFPVFGTFRVSSEGGGAYEVEIRSPGERLDSCSCPDFRINGLATCKHLEAVRLKLGRKAQKSGGSPRAEVFLARTGARPEVRLRLPTHLAFSSPPARLLAPFFSAEGALLGDPVAALPELARAVAEAPAESRRVIRLSRLLPPWVEAERRKVARGAARERFLAAPEEEKRRLLSGLRLPLYPYQEDGMLHLAFTERALLADEMGLGKTVQAIAACELLRQLYGIERVLVITPTSLKGEWEEQIAKFTGLPVRFIQGSRAQRLAQYGAGSFFYLANYEQIVHDAPDIDQRLAPDIIVLDEAQRIKNWQSKTARAVKRLSSPYAFVLTGTPLENRIEELYSIVQFLDPEVFGPLFRFNRDFYQLDERGKPAGYKNLGELNRRLAPLLLRRRKAQVEDQLPERTVSQYFVPMEPEQRARYGDYEAKVARLSAEAQRRQLSPEEFKQLQMWLSCMRMICDTPYILDSDCRVCPKLGELEEILAELLAEPATKVLVFSEWQRMLELVRELAGELGVGIAWHTGSVPQVRRREEIRKFKEDPRCRLFLSTDSGGVGLNLQAANVVINLDLPWNPARLEQRIARAWRKHQTRPVHVVHLVTEDSLEHRMLPLLAGKQALADQVLDGLGDLDVMPIPSSRAALVERLGQLLGSRAAPPPAGEPGEPSPAPPERLRDDLLAELGERLLLLEAQTLPGGAEILLAVVEGPLNGERAAVESLAQRHFPGGLPPRVEILDRATFATLERLAAAGFLELTAASRSRVYLSQALETSPEDEERSHRLTRAQESFTHAERKVRMAALLATGGFSVEALAPLREGVEKGFAALAELAGEEHPAMGETEPEWLAEKLDRFGIEDEPALFLWSWFGAGAETQLAVEETAAHAAVVAGERLVAQLNDALGRAAEG